MQFIKENMMTPSFLVEVVEAAEDAFWILEEIGDEDDEATS